jgi:hypothetical protein
MRGIAIALVVALGCGKKSGDDKPPPAPSKTAPADAGISVMSERVTITSVEIKVVDPTVGPAREIYPRQLAQQLGATLEKSEWFVEDGEPPPPGMRLRRAVVEVLIGYSVVPEGSTGEPAVIAVVEAQLDFRDGHGGMRPAMNILAERGYTKKEEKLLDGIVAEHVARAVSDAADGLIVKERIRVGMPEEAIAALDSKDVDVRVWALAVVGNRELTDAMDAVVERLEAETEEERDGAIGALVAMKDRRAVAALTRLADFQDHELMRRVLDAVASLGGDEALDYLEFVASGHPDEEIQSLASGALRRLKRRAERARKLDSK